MNAIAIAAALRILANAFEAPADAAQPTPEPQKRGRGRPVKGEDSAPTSASAGVTSSSAPATTGQLPTEQPASGSATTASSTTADSDPFATAPAAPTATQDEVRAALTALRAATSQDAALKVLKDAGGVANITDLKPEKYGVVVAAARTAQRIAAESKPAPEADPFEATAPVVEPEKPKTMDDVRAAAVAAGKRTSQDTVQKVVMKHGGKAAKPEGGEAVSLKALPEANYAACIKEIEALPTTK